jgi:hypothetical protein
MTIQPLTQQWAAFQTTGRELMQAVDGVVQITFTDPALAATPTLGAMQGLLMSSRRQDQTQTLSVGTNRLFWAKSESNQALLSREPDPDKDL